MQIESYCKFLTICNGARCGLVDLYSFEMLCKSQYRVKEISGGENNWICIGQILYEPIAINKTDKKVYRFYQGHEKDINYDCFGSFDEFLSEYVFGNKYIDIIPSFETDGWNMLIKNIRSCSK